MAVVGNVVADYGGIMPVVTVIFDDSCVGCNTGSAIHSNLCTAGKD